jgi:hypothetical protein
VQAYAAPREVSAVVCTLQNAALGKGLRADAKPTAQAALPPEGGGGARRC